MDDQYYGDEEMEPVGGPPKRKGPNPVAKAVADLLDQEDLISDRTGMVWRYDGLRWVSMTKAERQRMALTYGGRAAQKASVRTEIAELAALKVQRREIPWRAIADHEIACRSGILDLRTGRQREHREEDYLETVLPWDYEPAARCPAWTEALETWFGSADGSKAMALQEFAGYVLMPHAKLKKALLLYGPGDTGKSDVVWGLEQLVGRDQCCTLSVEEMEDATKRNVLRGKMLNRTAEISARALIRDAGFKTLVSTGEPVLLDPKYEHAYYYVPFAKHVFATNALPRIEGRSEEIFSRLLILHMDKVLAEAEQDREHQDKLAAEMPGIFAWAVAGAKALLDQGGQFSEPGGRAAILADWQRQQDPVLDWLQEVLKPAPAWRLPLTEVAKSASDALKRSVTAHEVGKAVRALGHKTDAVWHKSLKRSTRCILDMGIEAPVGMDENDMKGSGTVDEIPP